MVDWFGGINAGNPSDYQSQGQYQDRNQIHNVINQGLAGAPGRAAPQAQYGDQWRNMQLDQAQRLQGIANGQQAGAGELAVNRQVSNALAGQMAQARSARGANSALAYRNAANNSAQVGLQGAGQAQQAALSDQQAAQSQLTSALNGGRGQDQQIDLANLSAKLQQQGMNDQQVQAYLSQLTGMDANQLNAQMQAYGAAKASPGVAGGLLSAGGTILGGLLSDERLKTDIAPAGDETDALLDGLRPYSYRYKDAKHGEGPRVGIMAQDLERSEAGRRVVFESPVGKALDVNKALSAALAGTARLNERVRALEAKG